MATIKNTKKIKIGNTYIGGNEKIAIQSMLNAPSFNLEQNVTQAKILEQSGCDILRVAIPNKEALKLIPAIKQAINIPLVADIHFDYKLAIESVMAGADKIRINPGNIGSTENIKQIVKACNSKNIPIRIGVNSGSIEKEILKKYSKPSADAMVESAMFHVKLLENLGFFNIVLSLKSSNVLETVKGYRLISKQTNYPLHLGITESGTLKNGVIKSSIGLGALLLDNIGDTIRVSLSADPTNEIEVAKQILKYTGHLTGGIEIISCPTCGRTRIDVIGLANKIEEKLKGIEKNLKVAVMGCTVNGPGEAKDADIGVSGGNGSAVLFKKGEIIKVIPEENIICELLAEIEKM